MVTQGTKWVANKWINIDPDYQRQARYQHMVSQQQQQQQEDEGDEGQKSRLELHNSDIRKDL